MFYSQIWSQVTVWYSFIKTVIFQIGSHSVKIIIIIYQALWHCLGVVLLAVGYFLKLPNNLRVQYVAPGPDEKDANVYFLPQKNSSELKFVL